MAEVYARSARAGAGIDDGREGLSRTPPPGEIVRGRRERGVFQTQRIVHGLRVLGMPDGYPLRMVAEHPQVAAGVHKPARRSRLPQRFDRPINRESFGDAAKVDAQIHAVKADAISRQQVHLRESRRTRTCTCRG